MTQFKCTNNLSVEMCNSQPNKLKSGIENCPEVTLKLSPNVIGNSNDETYFAHRLLSTKAHVSRLGKALANDSSANGKLWRTKLYKTRQSGVFLGRPLGPLLRTGLPFIGSILKASAKSILIPLGLKTKASETDAAIH